MNKFFAVTCLALGVIALPLAASAQDVLPRSEIVVTGKYQKDWEKGSKLEAEGLKSLEGAKRDLVKYSADVVDAQNKRDSSDARSNNSENEFRRLTGEPIYFSSSKEALDWAKSVEKAAEGWAKYDNRGEDGRDDLGDAIKKQKKAQESVNDAQAKVDRGRTMMIEAQRKSAALSAS